jgi:hypothetical protein
MKTPYTADTSITAVQAMTLPIKKTAVLTVRLPPKVKASLKAAADAERRSLANMLEVVVIEYCEKRGIGPVSTQKRVKAK